LRKKPQPQETQALVLASSQSWLPLLRPRIPIGWRLRLFREIFTQQTQAPAKCSVEVVATMIGCLPTQAIAFEWKPGLSPRDRGDLGLCVVSIIMLSHLSDVNCCLSQQADD